ncbi:MAG TPA: zinc-ribbon domain-containing protein [Terriglobales bacterium]|nr:zinc-ribbon domain-containing protein [Terriglobales bacterium]
MTIVCTQCGAQISEESTACSGCGHELPTQPPPGVARGIPDNIVGALAYVTFIPAIVFLFVEPFNKSRFVRFHSLQSLLLALALGLLGIALKIVFAVLSLVPIVGRLMMMLLLSVVTVGCFILWIVLLIKALQGQAFKLPVIGDWAERQAEYVD